ncbi:hypothetical protein Sf12_gp45 [Shigella phage Sf12]|uniref:Uncharacterized protein n=1 Tax=Shigella phage Sf12 TaxID=2024315 RepID=A0A291AXM9_9CAUD|nr:hypothetical protein HOR99_gp44 [Shigella phage Sf12]ATE85771.1 hypothetical protein Sf12_gp45 [Shigella phage Sf12]
MKNFPKSQFVLVHFHNGKPFSVTIDNSGDKPLYYEIGLDEWVELSFDEISHYSKNASKVITSED